MNLLFERLKEYVPELQASAGEAAERLTLAGVAVERVVPGPGGTVLETDITSNRPDLLSYVGVARELAALFRTRLRLPTAPLTEDREPARDAARVVIEEPRLCPRYSARIVRGLRVVPSSASVRSLLEASGVRAINAAVDVTNLVLLELGHPTHAFDLAKLEGSRIVVRRAEAGESLRTLDGVERKLHPDDLVIADASRAVALAGVMGGAETEIGESTRDVLVESACFDPVSVRRTARRHGLRTEASIRFERRADPDGTVRAADRVASLLVEACGGVALAGAIDEYPGRMRRARVRLRLQRLEALLGAPVRASEVLRVLEAIGFHAVPAEQGAIDVDVPSFRGDVEREIDLVEEVGRILGYDAIPARLPVTQLRPPGLTRAQQRERLLRDVLAGAGFHEAVTLSMVDPEREAAWLGAEAPLVRIENPLSERLSALRGSIASGLLEVVGHNLRHGAESVSVYEMARTFAPDPGGGLPHESWRLGLAAAGRVRTRGDQSRARAIDAYDVQGTLDLAARTLRLPPGTWAGAARVVDDPAVLDRHGVTAELHVLVAEVELEAALQHDPGPMRYRAFSRFPGSTRDVSVFLAPGSETLPYADLERAVRQSAPDALESVSFVDYYQGKGRVSLTLRLLYRHPERTLSAEEVDLAHARVRDALRSDRRLELREG